MISAWGVRYMSFKLVFKELTCKIGILWYKVYLLKVYTVISIIVALSDGTTTGQELHEIWNYCWCYCSAGRLSRPHSILVTFFGGIQSLQRFQIQAMNSAPRISWEIIIRILRTGLLILTNDLTRYVAFLHLFKCLLSLEICDILYSSVYVY